MGRNNTKTKQFVKYIWSASYICWDIWDSKSSELRLTESRRNRRGLLKHMWRLTDISLIIYYLHSLLHDDVIKRKPFLRYRAFGRESTGHQRIPLRERPVMRSFDVFFDLRLKKRLGKSRRRWCETPSRLLWGHGDEKVVHRPSECMYIVYQTALFQFWWLCQVNLALIYTFHEG